MFFCAHSCNVTIHSPLSQALFQCSHSSSLEYPPWFCYDRKTSLEGISRRHLLSSPSPKQVQLNPNPSSLTKTGLRLKTSQPAQATEPISPLSFHQRPSNCLQPHLLPCCRTCSLLLALSAADMGRRFLLLKLFI